MRGCLLAKVSWLLAIFRNFPCKIPCLQGIRAETRAISTASPASQPVCGSENFSVSCGNGPPMAGFPAARSLYRDRIRAIIFRNRPTFSRQPLKSSRFLESRAGDRRIKSLRAAMRSFWRPMLSDESDRMVSYHSSEGVLIYAGLSTPVRSMTRICFAMDAGVSRSFLYQNNDHERAPIKVRRR